MTIYILPDKVDAFKKKLNRMISHLEIKPYVTYSEPIQHKITDLHIYNKGWGGRAKNVYFLDLIEVTIDDVCQGDWLIVATVFHDEGVVEMINTQIFKDMPKQFGSGYYKCDHCGRKESRRSTSHVIYNTKTQEWRQVGSTCINKMFNNGKYLADFAVKLFNLIEINFGSCDLDSFGYGGKIPNHYYKQAIYIPEMIAAVIEYRQKESRTWVKSEYKNGYKISEGSTHFLNERYNLMKSEGRLVVDTEYVKKVYDYVNSLDSENDFCANIKSSFNAEYVDRGSVYTIFYAVKMYEDSLNSFADKVNAKGICKGERCHIKGKLNYHGCEESYYGLVFYFTINDEATGFTFRKESGSRTVFNKFMINEDTVECTSMVSYISNRDEMITLSGRLSK